MKKLLASIALAGLASTANAIPVEWAVADGGNGHFYHFVAGNFTWHQALDESSAMTANGWEGYLATVTSEAENNFLSNSVSNQVGWLGGSDAGNALNDWTWRTGPEAGQSFTFTAWSSGEPNNCCGGEDYLQHNWVGNRWNDHGGPGNPGQRNGFFVEFSAPPIPEPGTYALLLAGLGLVGVAARRRTVRG